MAPADEYSTVAAGGRLKLKGSKVQDGRIEKKKKKKKEKKEKDKTETDTPTGTRSHDEGNDVERSRSGSSEARERGGSASRSGSEVPGAIMVGKTEAEKRYEEARWKRLHERLKREGIKSHKERVEELNRYLSNLSEHHDMPKIGPG
ncbi:hypothetical protein VTO42DRAFT_7766 [Malbranchea cinnamomea]